MNSILFVLFHVILISSGHTDLYVLIGESGAGKSSIINWLAGQYIAEEGMLDSITSKPTLYDLQFNNKVTHFLDTPGILDTRFTNEQILKMIQIEIIKLNNKMDRVQGVFVILDGSNTRVRIQESLLSALLIFSPEVKKSVLFCINFNEKIPEHKKVSIEQTIRSIFKENSIGFEQYLFIDSKSNSVSYKNNLMQKVRLLSPTQINSYQQLEAKIETYFKEELQNPNNYDIKQINDPITYTETKYDHVNVQESYQYECNCRKVCKARFIVCLNKKWVCGTCWGTRSVPRSIPRVVNKVRYQKREEKKLKNEESYYRKVASERVIEELRSQVYKRSDGKNEL